MKGITFRKIAETVAEQRLLWHMRGRESAVAVHPADGPPAQEFYLMCDDLAATMAELGERGVEFAGPPSDRGWGLLTSIKLPGGGELGLYEPRHPIAHS